MNWQAIGAIGEVVGGLAVVISLIYLAVQVRSGTKAVRTTTRDSSFHSLQEWNYYVFSDPELSWVFQQGSANPHLLDEQQKARYGHVMYSWYKLFENIYLHYCDGSVGVETWEHNRRILDSYAVQPGARHYWRQRRLIFDPRFREVVDSIEASELMPGHEVAHTLGAAEPASTSIDS